MKRFAFWAALGFLLFTRGNAAPVQRCEICHAKPDFKKVLENNQIQSLYVPPDSIAHSVHRLRECTDCHRDVTEIPHKKDLQRVDCTQCHYIGNLVGAPETEKYEQYRESVHGQAALAGNSKAPLCADCHGAHNVQVPHSEESPLNHRNVAYSCGRCHVVAFADYRESIHGKLMIAGNPNTPTCTNCHGEHTIASPSQPSSSVFPANIPDTCGKCHAAERIANQYGLSLAPVPTYTESFHGIATAFGSKTAANCASCHGYHHILPPDDPQSTVYSANLPKTCGKCHPEANANWARGKIHVDASKKEAGIIFYVASFFKWLTILTLTGLLINIALDFSRRIRGHKKK